MRGRVHEALRPLGLGTIHSRLAPIVSACGPTRASLRPNESRYAVTPAMAMYRGCSRAASSREPGAAGLELGAGQLRGLGGGPGDQVRDAQPVAGQQILLTGSQPPGGEARSVQRGPEPVAGPGEVMAGRGGVQARVDAAEQHVERLARRGQHVRHRAAAGRRQVKAAIRLIAGGRHRTTVPPRASGSPAVPGRGAATKRSQNGNARYRYGLGGIISRSIPHAPDTDRADRVPCASDR